MKNQGILLATLIAAIIHHALAFPTGAGGCGGPDVAAVGGQHLDNSLGRPVISTDLQQAAVTVSVGNIVLDPGAVNDLPLGQDLLIGVEAQGLPYLGVLARLQLPDGVNTDGALIPEANTQLADACTAPVVGITHTDNMEKSLATGMLRFDEPFEGGNLSVTIVFVNTSPGSAYAFSNFNIRVLSDGETVSPSMSDSGTDAPDTDMPVKSPAAPVAPPTITLSPTPRLQPPTVITPTRAPLDIPAPVAPINSVSGAVLIRTLPIPNSPVTDAVIDGLEMACTAFYATSLQSVSDVKCLVRAGAKVVDVLEVVFDVSAVPIGDLSDAEFAASLVSTVNANPNAYIRFLMTRGNAESRAFFSGINYLEAFDPDSTIPSLPPAFNTLRPGKGKGKGKGKGNGYYGKGKGKGKAGMGNVRKGKGKAGMGMMNGGSNGGKYYDTTKNPKYYNKSQASYNPTGSLQPKQTNYYDDVYYGDFSQKRSGENLSRGDQVHVNRPSRSREPKSENKPKSIFG